MDTLLVPELRSGPQQVTRSQLLLVIPAYFPPINWWIQRPTSHYFLFPKKWYTSMEPPTEDVKGKIESKNFEMFEIEGVNDLKAKDFKANF